MTTKIPQTGRIGRYAKIVEKEVDQDRFLRIMQDSDTCASLKQKAAWWKTTIDRKEGEIEYKAPDERTIVGHFYRCFCVQVKQTTATFSKTTYCQFSAEFHKQYFEAALEQPVEVEIVQSIISGAPYCKFRI